MHRKVSMTIAFSAVLASPVVYPSEHPSLHPAVKTAKDTKRAERPHFTKVSAHSKNAIAINADHQQVAMAPTEAEVDGWRVKLASAGPASEVTQDLIHQEEKSDDSKLNIYGMLAAALGLGGLSIVRRMGRF